MQAAITANQATATLPCLMTGHEDAHAARIERSVVKSHHVDGAASIVLGDLEAISDWLAGECCNRAQVSSDYATRVPGRLLLADTPVLMHAAMIAADRGDKEGCFEAMRVFTQRVLELQDSRLQSLARELAGA